MVTKLYHLQITGVISSEEQEHEAISALANILVVPLSKAQLLFSHAPIIIKENIDRDSALQIESELQQHGIECKLLSAVDAQSPVEEKSIHDKLMNATEIDTSNLSSLSISEDWAPESSGSSQHQPIEDVHRYSHQGGDKLSAYHLDDLNIDTKVPEVEHHEAEHYSGPERRVDQRRKHDRRDAIRFDLENKNDRRKKDRRESDVVWVKYHADI